MVQPLCRVHCKKLKVSYQLCTNQIQKCPWPEPSQNQFCKLKSWVKGLTRSLSQGSQLRHWAKGLNKGLSQEYEQGPRSDLEPEPGLSAEGLSQGSKPGVWGRGLSQGSKSERQSYEPHWVSHQGPPAGALAGRDWARPGGLNKGLMI